MGGGVISYRDQDPIECRHFPMFSLRALEPHWSFLSFYILHRLSGQQKRHNGESRSLIIALNKNPKAFSSVFFDRTKEEKFISSEWWCVQLVGWVEHSTKSRQGARNERETEWVAQALENYRGEREMGRTAPGRRRGRADKNGSARPLVSRTQLRPALVRFILSS